MERELTIVKKKRRKRAARCGRSIRVGMVPLSAGLDSPGENGETRDITPEGLTRAVVAFIAPDNSGNAFILRVDPR